MKGRSLVLIGAPMWALLACGGVEAPPAVAPPEVEPPPAVTARAPVPEPAPVEEPAWVPPAAVEIRAIDAPRGPDKVPKVTIVAPRSNEVVRADKAASFAIKLDVEGWQAGGSHVHLVLDGKPYLDVLEPQAIVRLGDVSIEATLDEGPHVIAAFAVDDAHVSVKPDKGKIPLAITAFSIGKGGKSAWKPGDPTLVYSRPKGTYNGDAADEIVVDWYLVSAELGEGKYSVRVSVTPPRGGARTTRATRWAPLAIVGLPNGETRVKLELLGRDGKPAPGPWNSVERVITVNRGAR